MKRQLLKKIYTSSLVYTLANSIEALAPFVLAIILTRRLSPDEYGIWVLFIALFTFLRPLISLSVQDALKMHYFELDRQSLSEFTLSSFAIISVMTLFFYCIAVFGKEYISAWVKFPDSWLTSIVLAAYLYSVFFFLLTLNQFKDNRKQFFLLHIIQSSVSIALVFAFVFSEGGWQGAILGKLGGLLMVSFTGAWWLVKDLKFEINTNFLLKLKEIIKFGLHYLPTGLSLVIIPFTDRMIITHFLGLNEVGLYGVSALFGSAFFIAINGFMYAWMPWLFRRLKEYDEQAQKDVRVVSMSFAVLLPISATIFHFFCLLIAPFIIGVSFYNAFVLIPWVLLAFVMQGYFFHNQAFLLFKKNTTLISTCSFFCIVLNIILSYLWAMSYGITGVILATAASYFLSWLLSSYFVFRGFKNVKIMEFNNV